ncbi:MAG: hypothetical protein RR990_05880 [Lachnospiraceae bacterium]
MAKAKKLPSGSWRAQVYNYTDSIEKRYYESFTSDDQSPAGKREAEYLAAEYAMNMKRGGWSSDRTLKEVYRNVLEDQDKKFTSITNKHFDKIMQHEMQHD